MLRTKATIRGLPAEAASDFQPRTVGPFQIKGILPQQKTVNIKKKKKKNGQVTKTINVRRKSKYFSVRSRLIY